MLVQGAGAGAAVTAMGVVGKSSCASLKDRADSFTRFEADVLKVQERVVKA